MKLNTWTCSNWRTIESYSLSEDKDWFPYEKIIESNEIRFEVFDHGFLINRFTPSSELLTQSEFFFSSIFSGDAQSFCHELDTDSNSCLPQKTLFCDEIIDDVMPLIRSFSTFKDVRIRKICQTSEPDHNDLKKIRIVFWNMEVWEFGRCQCRCNMLNLKNCESLIDFLFLNHIERKKINKMELKNVRIVMTHQFLRDLFTNLFLKYFYKFDKFKIFNNFYCIFGGFHVALKLSNIVDCVSPFFWWNIDVLQSYIIKKTEFQNLISMWNFVAPLIDFSIMQPVNDTFSSYGWECRVNEFQKISVSENYVNIAVRNCSFTYDGEWYQRCNAIIRLNIDQIVNIYVSAYYSFNRIYVLHGDAFMKG